MAAGSGIGQSFAVPQTQDSLTQVSRCLWALLNRDSKRRLLERIAARAGVDLSAAASWLLARLEESPETSGGPELAASYAADPVRLADALTELRSKGLVLTRVPRSHSGRPPGARATRAARRDGLAELLADWSPEQHRDLSEFLAGSPARWCPTPRTADEAGPRSGCRDQSILAIGVEPGSVPAATLVAFPA